MAERNLHEKWRDVTRKRKQEEMEIRLRKDFLFGAAKTAIFKIRQLERKGESTQELGNLQMNLELFLNRIEKSSFGSVEALEDYLRHLHFLETYSVHEDFSDDVGKTQIREILLHGYNKKEAKEKIDFQKVDVLKGHPEQIERMLRKGYIGKWHLLQLLELHPDLIERMLKKGYINEDDKKSVIEKMDKGRKRKPPIIIKNAEEIRMKRRLRVIGRAIDEINGEIKKHIYECLLRNEFWKTENPWGEIIVTLEKKFPKEMRKHARRTREIIREFAKIYNQLKGVRSGTKQEKAIRIRLAEHLVNPEKLEYEAGRLIKSMENEKKKSLTDLPSHELKRQIDDILYRLKTKVREKSLGEDIERKIILIENPPKGNTPLEIKERIMLESVMQDVFKMLEQGAEIDTVVTFLIDAKF